VDSVRHGELPGSPSGDTAAAINKRWNDLREAGHLSDPRLEFEAAPVTWHWPAIIAAAILAVGCVLSVVL
jgi:hypothetical protein